MATDAHNGCPAGNVALPASPLLVDVCMRVELETLILANLNPGHQMTFDWANQLRGSE
jgi:hypothetical protein